ncbi:MAG TPA: F0F1 ATP synthase subunit gamma [Gallionella sp.]|nr:F0F1 ATP synthase subunit gamma [Gallionella sp.]
MSETSESLRRKIAGAQELASVVRTMKSLAAASVTQYEHAVRSLDDYYRAVELGLAAWVHRAGALTYATQAVRTAQPVVGAVIFGSDQGLVGQFNEVLVEFVVDTLNTMPGSRHVWAVGERVHGHLVNASVPVADGFAVPNSIGAVTALVGRVLVEIEAQRERSETMQIYLFHNRPRSGAVYEPVSQRLVPLDETWRYHLTELAWPTKNLPEVMDSSESALRALIREYLFISLFRACTESLASENASRLVAMQRAEKNIEELLEVLSQTYHRFRQNSIDAELFDVIAGYELLFKGKSAAER